MYYFYCIGQAMELLEILLIVFSLGFVSFLCFIFSCMWKCFECCCKQMWYGPRITVRNERLKIYNLYSKCCCTSIKIKLQRDFDNSGMQTFTSDDLPHMTEGYYNVNIFTGDAKQFQKTIDINSISVSNKKSSGFVYSIGMTTAPPINKCADFTVQSIAYLCIQETTNGPAPDGAFEVQGCEEPGSVHTALLSAPSGNHITEATDGHAPNGEFEVQGCEETGSANAALLSAPSGNHITEVTNGHAPNVEFEVQGCEETGSANAALLSAPSGNHITEPLLSQLDPADYKILRDELDRDFSPTIKNWKDVAKAYLTSGAVYAIQSFHQGCGFQALQFFKMFKSAHPKITVKKTKKICESIQQREVVKWLEDNFQDDHTWSRFSDENLNQISVMFGENGLCDWMRFAEEAKVQLERDGVECSYTMAELFSIKNLPVDGGRRLTPTEAMLMLLSSIIPELTMADFILKLTSLCINSLAKNMKEIRQKHIKKQKTHEL